MDTKTTRQIGDQGENLACDYLVQLGWEILDRNYFSGHSEVDIIARDEAVYVFIEVKMRSNTKYGHPIEYVTENKVAHVFKAAEAWMREQKITNTPMRFDVIGILKEKNKPPNFTHLKDAFR
ncbi:MAG: YraN family protein [Balneolaceae bacterium]